MLAITDYQSHYIHALHLYENKTNNQPCALSVNIINLSGKICLTIFGGSKTISVLHVIDVTQMTTNVISI